MNYIGRVIHVPVNSLRVEMVPGFYLIIYQEEEEYTDRKKYNRLILDRPWSKDTTYYNFIYDTWIDRGIYLLDI